MPPTPPTVTPDELRSLPAAGLNVPFGGHSSYPPANAALPSPMIFSLLATRPGTLTLPLTFTSLRPRMPSIWNSDSAATASTRACRRWTTPATVPSAVTHLGVRPDFSSTALPAQVEDAVSGSEVQ